MKPDFLPTHLPERPAWFSGGPHLGSRRIAQRSCARRSAWLLTECQVAAFDYFALDCPKSAGDYIRRLGPHLVSSVQNDAFEQLFADNLRFCRPRPGLSDLGRGMLRFSNLLDDFEQAWSLNPEGYPAGRTSCVALPVDPARVQIPAAAGILDPCTVLTETEQKVFLDVQARVKPNWNQVDLPKFCYMVAASDEVLLRARLLSSGMASLIPDHDVPRTNRGLPLLGGLFAVEHKAVSDRLIFDRRPQNFCEHQLNWSRLPYGPQLCRLVLKDHEGVRGSGDDLRTWFYQLRNAPAARSRNVFGRIFDGANYSDYGGKSGVSYRMALDVLAMGDVNAVDVAQCTHTRLLQRFGCMQSEHTLIYPAPLPLSRTMEGLYIDDHFCISIVDKKDLGGLDGPDRELISRSHEAYEHFKVPRAPEKAFGFSRGPAAPAETNFTVLGTEVNSSLGLVSAPLLKRQQLFCLASLALELPKVSPELLDRFIGLFMHIFMHRRELMCVFGRVHSWCRSLAPGSFHRLPVDVRVELSCAALWLSIAQTNIRWPIDGRISATDATPQSGGAVHAYVPDSLAAAFWRTTEQRGAYVRLDTRDAPGLSSQDPDPLAGELVECMQWTVHRSRTFRSSKHVNLQELEEVCEELRASVRRDIMGSRHVNIVDSLVSLGAWCKGRSSSFQINKKLRRVVGWRVLGRKSLENMHVRSASNPADDPSRLRPLAPPKPAEPWMLSLLHPDAPSPAPRQGARSFVRRFVECYAGQGGLTAALRSHGWLCDEPFEAYPSKENKTSYRPEFDLSQHSVQDALLGRIHRGQLGYAHFGLPCRTWGPAGRLAGGTRRRDLPLGTGVLARETQANRELAFVVVACCDLCARGAYFSLENPRDSYVFGAPLWLELVDVVGLVGAVFDQCAYGLRLDPSRPSVFSRKPTRVVHNIPELACLSRKCPGVCRSHVHERVWGSLVVNGQRKSRTQLAGTYPGELCCVWAQSIKNLNQASWPIPDPNRLRALRARAMAALR